MNEIHFILEFIKILLIFLHSGDKISYRFLEQLQRELFSPVRQRGIGKRKVFGIGVRQHVVPVRSASNLLDTVLEANFNIKIFNKYVTVVINQNIFKILINEVKLWDLM